VNDSHEGAGFFALTVRRPVGVFMVFLAMMVFGGFSARLLPLNLMPDIAYPKLTVRTEYAGAAPGEVEVNVSRPLEEVLGVVSGVTRIESISRAGFSDVVLEFEWSTPMDQANQDVLEVLDVVTPNLPEGVDDPLILRYDPTLDPVLTLSLRGQGDRYRGDAGRKLLRRLADRDLRRALEPIPGVAAIKVSGGLEEEIEIDVDEGQLRRLGLSIDAVADRLAAHNVNLAGGTLQDGRSRYLVRTVNEFRDIEDIQEVVVLRTEDREVRLRDLAVVRAGYKDRDVITRINGVEAVEVEVYKEADANIVEMVARVREHVDDVAAPAILRQHEAIVAVSSDRSRFIESSLAEVQTTALLGGALAVVVLLAFLRDLRSTLVVATSIPVSVLMTFAPLHLCGVSLNIMSLGGLALGIGMLVDNSIVVLESIYRCREEGDDLVPATIRGTAEVGGAVTASTLTSIAVFLPMVFVEGVAGQMFGDLGLAVVFSLGASLVVALVLVPMLVSREVGRRDATPADLSLWQAWRRLFRTWPAVAELGAALRWIAPRPLAWLGVPYVILRFIVRLLFAIVSKLLLTAAILLCGVTFAVVAGLRALWRPLSRPVLALTTGVGASFTAIYLPLLRACLRYPGRVSLLVLGGSVGVVMLGTRVDTELIPELHQGEFTAELSLPVGTSLAATDARVSPIEREAMLALPELASLTATLGSDADAVDSAAQGQHTARLRVVLDPDAAAMRSPKAQEMDALARLRGLFADEPDLQVDVRRPVLFSFKTPIEVEVRGYELEPLAAATQEVEARLLAIPVLRDVKSMMRPGSPELHIHYDRDALARYGLDVRTVAERIRDKVQGSEATQFNRIDRKIPVRVRLADIEGASEQELRGLVINPGGTRPIPLGAVAEVRVGRGPSEIRRIGQQRVGLVTASVEGGSLSAAVARIEASLADVELAPGMAIEITGQSAEWERSSQSLALALGLSVFLVYVIMASQFESLLYPFIILLSIPLAFAGVVLVLVALDIPLSIVVLLGVIMLAGIVVNNAIVLVDYFVRLKARGFSSDDALIQAGSVRLRPIFMTTLTTVLGLLPMALGLGDGAEIRTPMAITVIAGLSLSTLLTLIVIPMLVSVSDRLLGKQSDVTPAERLANELENLDPLALSPDTEAGEDVP